MHKQRVKNLIGFITYLINQYGQKKLVETPLVPAIVVKSTKTVALTPTNMNEKKYVIGIAFSRDGNDIVLIHKNRPDWQKGKFNGIGGKVELEDSSPNEAMIREFKEETGVDTFHGGPYGWHHFATMIFNNDIMGGSAIVYCYKMKSNVIYQCESTTDEEVVRMALDTALTQKPLMQNLPTLIHLAKSEFEFTELNQSKI